MRNVSMRILLLALCLTMTVPALAGDYLHTQKHSCSCTAVPTVRGYRPAHKQVVVQHVLHEYVGVPHAYNVDPRTPSLGDEAAYFAGELEKRRQLIARDALKIAALDRQHQTVISLGVGERQVVQTVDPCLQQSSRSEQLRAAVSATASHSYATCASCHAPANAAKGGDLAFSSFAELSPQQRAKAAELVLTGEMPDGAPLDVSARISVSQDILRGAETSESP